MSRNEMRYPWDYIVSEFKENSYNEGLGQRRIDEFTKHIVLMHTLSVHNKKLRKEVEDLIILFCKGELK